MSTTQRARRPRTAPLPLRVAATVLAVAAYGLLCGAIQAGTIPMWVGVPAAAIAFGFLLYELARETLR